MNQFKPGRRTLVVVHGYDGDKDLIAGSLPQFESHQCPILVLSPEDAPIKEMGQHICRWAGKKGQLGPATCERQLLHYQIALEYNVDFYLMYDADSLSLEPEIPEYLYEHYLEVFSNEVMDARHNQPGADPNYHKPLPPIAMQPPYFMSKASLAKMVAAAPSVEIDDITPFQDWYPVQLCWAAGLRMSALHNAHSSDSRNPEFYEKMKKAVANDGVYFVHAVKSTDARDTLQRLYNKRKSSIPTL